jgi:hypothetical protein
MGLNRVILPEIVPQRLRVDEDYSTDVFRYGYYNTYPQEILEKLRASGITSGAVSLFQDFIFGEGFEDESFGNSVVNKKGQTANDLLSEYAIERSIFSGASFHINYNMLLESENITIIPYQFCRIARFDSDKSGKIGVYDNWAGESYERRKKSIKDIEYIDHFTNDLEKTQQQIENAGGFENWKGQVLYYSSQGHSRYPLCVFDAVINDVETDALYSTYRKRTGQNNFNPSVILDFLGDYEDDDQKKIEKSVKNFQGSENAGNALMFFGNNTDAEGNIVKNVEVTVPSTQNNDDIYVNQERSVQGNITRLFKQPKVLVAMDDSGLFNQDQMENAYTFYNEVTKKQRTEASRIFESIFSNYSDNINPSGNYRIKAKQYGEINVSND